MAIQGKVCWLTKKDIKKLCPTYDFDNWDINSLYDIAEEHVHSLGFVTYDNDIKFVSEQQIWHHYEYRYTCAIVKGIKRNGKFLFGSFGIQYKFIK